MVAEGARGGRDPMSERPYLVRFFFDAGSGTTLWPGDDLTRADFGSPIDPSALPISENLRRYLTYLAAWYDTSIDWEYPPRPRTWTSEEACRFDEAVVVGIARLEQELGSAFEIVVEYSADGQA